MLEELRARPADEPWMDSVRHVLRIANEGLMAQDPDMIRMRAHLAVTVPAVRARMVESMSETGRMLRQALAERSGLDPDGLEVRVCAMSLIGGLMETSLYWAENDFKGDLSEHLNHALDVLEHGLPTKKP